MYKTIYRQSNGSRHHPPYSGLKHPCFCRTDILVLPHVVSMSCAPMYMLLDTTSTRPICLNQTVTLGLKAVHQECDEPFLFKPCEDEEKFCLLRPIHDVEAFADALSSTVRVVARQFMSNPPPTDILCPGCGLSTRYTYSYTQADHACAGPL